MPISHKRLALVDRDGTINVERHYLSAPEQIEIYPRAAEAVAILKELGLVVVVVTNQSGVGRGYFDLERLNLVHRRFEKALAAAGVAVDALYFCPHAPEEGCSCRKPATGMARRAAETFGADLKKSFVIGDNVCDIELGRAVGATSVLVRTGHGARVEREGKITPDYSADDLFEAANLIKNLLETT